MKSKQTFFQKGVFIIGVRKSGTTTLYEALANSNVFRQSTVKEPQFFALSTKTITQHLDWYNNLFEKETNKPILDGSTLYYQYPESYNRINQLFEEATYILCLRDPAKRFYSAYWHMRSKAGGIEKRTFEEILLFLEQGTSQEEILQLESLALEQAIINKTINDKYLDNQYHHRQYNAPFSTTQIDKLAFFSYYKESLYSKQVEAFTAQQKHKIVLFEELTNNFDATLSTIFDFLNIALADRTQQLTYSNKTQDYSSSALVGILHKLHLVNTLKRIAGTSTKQFIKNLVSKKIPKMTPQQYLRTRRLLKKEYNYWHQKKPLTKDLWI